MADIKFPSEVPSLSPVTNDTVLLTSKGGVINKVTVGQVASKTAEIVQVDGGSIPAITGGATSATAVALPTLGDENRYFDASAGYWKYNNVVLTNPKGVEGIPVGSEGVLFWNGTTQTWSISKVQALPVTETTSTIVEGGDLAVSQDGVYQNNKFILGETIYYFEPSELTGFTSGVALASGTIILDQKFTGVSIKEIKLWCTVAGSIVINTYTISDNLATRTRTKTVPIVLGINTITDYSINDGEYIGVSYNTETLLGRIGAKNETSPYGYWLSNVNIGGTPTAIGARLTSQRIAITVAVEANDSVKNQLDKTLQKTDLTTEFSSNLAKQLLNETVITDKLINSTGGISSITGWKMYAFYPLLSGLKSGDQFIVHNFRITGGGYVAWYEGTVMKTFEGSFNGITPKVFTVPLGSTESTILYFDLAQPSTVENYASLTINKGIVALPYVEPKEYISKIDDKELKGSQGATSFEELTDVPSYAGNAGKILQINSSENGLEAVDNSSSGGDVVFDSVTTSFLIVNDIPIWDEVSPTDVAIGQEYLHNDGSGNFFKKVRGV